MKAGWEVKPLEEICEIKPPKKLAKAALEITDDVSFVPMNKLGELEKLFEEQESRPLGKVYGGYTYFADDDVLVAKITPCFENGKMGIAKGLTNGVGFGSSEFVPLRSKGGIVPEFLFYFLYQNEFRENGARIMTGAVGHRRVPKEYFEELPIPLPPLEEQKRIVAVLDGAFDALTRARAHTEANLLNARELFESVLNEYLNLGAVKAGWEVKPLIEITDKIGSGATPRGGKSAYKLEGMSLIRSLNVHDLEFREKNLALIDDTQADALSNVGVQKGDVLLNITGASIARCCVVPCEKLPARVNQHVSILRPKPELMLSQYLAYLLVSKEQKDQLLGIGDEGGATRQALTKAQLQSFPVPLPPLEEQKRIVAVLDVVSERKKQAQAHYQQKLDDLDDLRQSLLQKAFAGELT